MTTISAKLKTTALIFFTAVVCSMLSLSVLHAQDSSIHWVSMEKAQKMAKKNGKKVLIFAEASWCVYCKKMHKQVFPQKAVVDSMNKYFYPVRIDVESSDSMMLNGKEITQQQFARAARVQATPTTFFLNQKGKKLGAQPGFIPAKTFSRLLGFIGSDSYKTGEFRNYMKDHATQ